MTWVKICGITNSEDARIAVDAGADALGFVFYDKSPRKIDVQTARQIAQELPVGVETVGVFVNEEPDLVVDIAQKAHLSAMQLYLGESNVSACRLFAPKAINTFVAMRAGWLLDHTSDLGKTISLLKSLAKEEDERERTVTTVFVDSGSLQVPGGTGKTFDWVKAAQMVSRISRSFRVVVAGGLNPTNVAEAMRVLQPWGVDVASGVELRPGKKDPEKVKAFVRAVREADKVD